MTRPLALALVLAGCAAAPPAPRGDAPPADLPAGTWRGTMVQDGVLRGVPTVLYVERDGSVELVPGGARVRADDVSFDDGRLAFRAPQFPVTPTQHRALRCNLLHGLADLRGTCRAGAATYAVSLRLSSSRS